MWRMSGWFVWCLVLLVAIVQMVWWYPRLPEIVPSHFDGRGQVDGEMAKPAFCFLIGGIQLLTIIGLPVLGYFLKQLPDSLINMPNKEYWLAEERRDDSLAVSFYMLLGISWLTGLLMIVIFQLSAQVAMKQRTGISPEMWIATVAYLVIVAGICGWSYYRFRLPAGVLEDDA